MKLESEKEVCFDSQMLETGCVVGGVRALLGAMMIVDLF